MKCELYHIAFVTRSLENALAFYRKLGLEPTPVEEDTVDKFRCSVVNLCGVKIMLMEPTDPDGPVGRYLAKRGEGFHHIGLRVADCRAAAEELKGRGIKLFWDEPREQSYEISTFVEPQSAHGILVEIVQPKP